MSDGQNQPTPMFGAHLRCDSKDMPDSTVPVKVFLADDSALIRGRVAAMLTQKAMNIVGHADTPQGSIDGILATHPDVVILDVQLDGGSGLQVLRAVRQVEPGIAFVVFTVNVEPAYRKRYLGEGARRFLDKTSECDQLVSAVQHSSCHGSPVFDTEAA